MGCQHSTGKRAELYKSVVELSRRKSVSNQISRSERAVPGLRWLSDDSIRRCANDQAFLEPQYPKTNCERLAGVFHIPRKPGTSPVGKSGTQSCDVCSRHMSGWAIWTHVRRRLLHNG